jgi:hypothetical protein
MRSLIGSPSPRFQAVAAVGLHSGECRALGLSADGRWLLTGCVCMRVCMRVWGVGGWMGGWVCERVGGWVGVHACAFPASLLLF